MRAVTILLNIIFLLLTVLAISEHGWQTEPKAAFAFAGLFSTFLLSTYFLLALKPAINIRGYLKPVNFFWLGFVCVLVSAGYFVLLYENCSWGGCDGGAKLIAKLDLTLMVVGLLLMIVSLIFIFKRNANTEKNNNENT